MTQKKSIRLFIDFESLRQSIKNIVESKTKVEFNLSLASSRIYFQIGGCFYPSNSWVDSPLIVLNWWLENLSTLKSTKKHTKNHFMGGPFYFDVGWEGDSGLELNFLSYSKEDIPKRISYGKITYDQYKEMIMSSCMKLVKIFSELEIKNKDLSNMIRLLHEIDN